VHVTIRMAAQHLALDSFWVEKCRYDDAERQYYEKLSGATLTPLADEVAKARQRLIEIGAILMMHKREKVQNNKMRAQPTCLPKWKLK